VKFRHSKGQKFVKVEMNNEEKAFNRFFKQLKIEDQKPASGRILLSEPFLADPNFTHSVILLVRHDTEGSVGFTINHPSDTKLNEILVDFPSTNSLVYVGGPVSNESLFYLHTLGNKLSGSIKIQEGLYWGGDFEELKELVASGQVSETEIIYLVGYSGWESGQLERELNKHSWIVTDISTENVFSGKSRELWNELLTLKSEAFKIVSNFPEDPNLN